MPPPPLPSGVDPVPGPSGPVTLAGSAPVRLVLLPEGPGGVLEIKPPKQNMAKIEGYEKIADLKLGEASDYLDIRAGSEIKLGGSTLLVIGATQPAQRHTIAIGTDADGKAYATGFVERAGKIDFTYGRGMSQVTRPVPETASLVLTAIGSGKSTKGKPLRLGVVGQGCLGDKAVTDEDFAAVEMEPGDVNLAWFADETCQQPAGDPERVSIEADQQAYVFAWAEGKGEPQVMYLPIEK